MSLQVDELFARILLRTRKNLSLQPSDMELQEYYRWVATGLQILAILARFRRPNSLIFFVLAVTFTTLNQFAAFCWTAEPRPQSSIIAGGPIDRHPILFVLPSTIALQTVVA